MPYDHDDLIQTIDCLRNGGIILYPTDTVWGIGCDATNNEAVSRIFAIKKRAEAKAMISLVADVAQFERFTSQIPDVAYELLDQAVSPLTLVVDSPVGLAPRLLAADGSAALRISHEPFNREICRRLRHPLVSTSANISGMPSPRFFHEIDPALIKQMDYVVKYRRDDTTPARPSSVIKISNDSSFKILRS
ncbi:MAG: L-threonylcarbamoyladenylate synthase [Bacteroides sp.]|nr:L-threonylcarbamoyladenylate synthase [Bacteroides sp.]